MFYRSDLEGDQSAVYVIRRRFVASWRRCGPIRIPLCRLVVGVRRVTRSPGMYVTTERSGWYTPTYCIDSHWHRTAYTPLGFGEGWKLWWKQRRSARDARASTSTQGSAGISKRAANPSAALAGRLCSW